MKAADLIALLKDARGALHGAQHGLVNRLDAAVAELEAANAPKPAARPDPVTTRANVRMPSAPPPMPGPE